MPNLERCSSYFPWHEWLPEWVTKKYLVPFKHLVLENEELGGGNFGNVRKGYVCDGAARWPVAVKVSKTQKGISTLIKEGKNMARIDSYNANIVNLQGVCATWIEDDDEETSRMENFYLLLEYCANGSVKNFLVEHELKFMREKPEEPYTKERLIVWAKQIAEGMEFLSSKNIVHGDLAARNILIHDLKTVKIADFDQSQEMPDETDSGMDVPMIEGQMPVFWMAIECLVDKMWTKENDVWAYGVLLWELFTLGKMPYADERLSTYDDIVIFLSKGNRLQLPYFAPHFINDIMFNCWRANPLGRPSFGQIIKRFPDLSSYEIVKSATKTMESQYNAVLRIQDDQLTSQHSYTTCLRTNSEGYESLPRSPSGNEYLEIWCQGKEA